MRGNLICCAIAGFSCCSSLGAGAVPADVPVKLVQITLFEEADLAVPEPGQLTEMLAREGDSYEEGELLSRLDDREAELMVQRAQAEYNIAATEAENDVNVRFAIASEEVAQARLKRGELSYERYKNSISEAQLDEFRLAAKEAELRIEQSRHEHKVAALELQIKKSELELARVKLEAKRIRAPFSGVVVEINAHEGEWVEQGVPIVRIVRLDRLRVRGFVDAKYLPSQLRGRKVKITIPRESESDLVLESELAFATPESNLVNNQRPVWAEIENASLELSPGMKAEMVILTGDRVSAARSAERR